MYGNVIGFASLMLMFAGCAMKTDNIAAENRQTQMAEIEQQLSDESIKELHLGLKELSMGTQDEISARERGKLLMRLAVLTHQISDTRQAIEILEAQMNKYPDRADIMVHLGACYSLLARDHSGILYVVTPLGLSRIVDIHKGIDLMNRAVAMDEFNPVVRLIRALPGIYMPKIFGQFDQGMADLQLLVSWIEQPETTQGLAIAVRSPGFASEVHYHLAQAFMMREEYHNALTHFQKAASVAPKTPTGRAAAAYVKLLNQQQVQHG